MFNLTKIITLHLYLISQTVNVSFANNLLKSLVALFEIREEVCLLRYSRGYNFTKKSNIKKIGHYCEKLGKRKSCKKYIDGDQKKEGGFVFLDKYPYVELNRHLLIKSKENLESLKYLKKYENFMLINNHDWNDPSTWEPANFLTSEYKNCPKHIRYFKSQINVKKIKESSFEISIQDFKYVVKNYRYLIMQYSPSLYKLAGKSKGMELSRVYEGSDLETLGLKSGHIILNINQYPVYSIQEVISILLKFTNNLPNHIVINYLENGIQKNINVLIKF
ncbi:MAG: hypothetical protein COB02_06250 [Candidatus Cloacimonadota bacterium]|nr:MAG: hypothetical protein COB02_06250 [Candidatus Cloacimonadota bacterium]